MTKTLPILLLAALLLTAGAGFVAHTRKHEKPDVEVAGGLVHDVGQVSARHPVTHHYRLTNPHAFPIGLAIGTTGCDCTTATVSTPLIAPHGVADVILNVKPEGTREISSGVSINTSHGSDRVETWLMLTGHFDGATH